MPRTLKVVLHVTVEDYPATEIKDLADNAMDCAVADMHTISNLNVVEIAGGIEDILDLSRLNDHLVDYDSLTAFNVTAIKSVEAVWLPN